MVQNSTLISSGIEKESAITNSLIQPSAVPAEVPEGAWVLGGALPAGRAFFQPKALKRNNMENNGVGVRVH